MTTINAPTAQPADNTDLAGITPQLRALLTAYSDTLATIKGGPVLTWINSGNGWVPPQIKSPALRYCVSALFVPYLYRSAEALKSGVTRRALSGAADGHSGDLAVLENFEKSLPPRLRSALIFPVVMMVVLSVAYVLASLCEASYRNLFGDLATAAITVNRAAALAAFDNAERLADVYQQPAKAGYFAGAAMIVTWSAVVAILPLLPAFYLVRRNLAALSEVETAAFDAVGARAAHEIELDLLVRLLLIPAVALLAMAALTQAATQRPATNLAIAVSVAIAVMSTALVVLAGMQLTSCYREGRNNGTRCRSFATKVSFALVTALSLTLFFALPVWERYHNREFNTWPREVATTPLPPPPKPAGEDDGRRGWLTNQVSFLVTKIKPNFADCTEPHGSLFNNAQYLEFDLEVWSDVDEFSNAATAHALTLPHWSIQDSKGASTGSLYMHTKCSRGKEAISEPIAAGSHTFTSVVVSAPTDAACLRLDVPSYRGVWKWPIPPVTGGCESD
jgi:hypothetical protein